MSYNVLPLILQFNVPSFVTSTFAILIAVAILARGWRERELASLNTY